jgi:hypothetical protein
MTVIRPFQPEMPIFRDAPHNLDAEQALLGAILVNNEAGPDWDQQPGEIVDAS